MKHVDCHFKFCQSWSRDVKVVRDRNEGVLTLFAITYDLSIVFMSIEPRMLSIF